MSWLAACKEYAAKAGRWTVPKRDTPEYAEVKKIMDRMAAERAKAAPAAEAAPAKPRAARKIPEPVPDADKKRGVTRAVKSSAKAAVAAETPARVEQGLKQAKKNARIVEAEPDVIEAVMPEKPKRAKATRKPTISVEPVTVSF